MSALPSVPPVPSATPLLSGTPSAATPAPSVPPLPDAPAESAIPGAPARSAAVVNMRIRALWARAGGALSPADQDRYQRLLEEWAAAVRADVVEAA